MSIFVWSSIRDLNRPQEPQGADDPGGLDSRATYGSVWIQAISTFDIFSTRNIVMYFCSLRLVFMLMKALLELDLVYVLFELKGQCITI